VTLKREGKYLTWQALLDGLAEFVGDMLKTKLLLRSVEEIGDIDLP
jgi:hypothetical protein